MTPPQLNGVCARELTLNQSKGHYYVIFTHEFCNARRQSEGELDLTNDLDAGRVILSIFERLRKKEIKVLSLCMHKREQ